MKLTSVVVDLEGGTASMGLFGEITEDNVRPPHVQVTVNIDATGDAGDMRRQAIDEALEALEAARAALTDAR